jgi:hypothetical protein
MIGHDYRHPHYWLDDTADRRYEMCAICGYWRRKKRPGFPERLVVAVLVPVNRLLRWLAR